jgi:parvulin-like peptidyl-prolyl isomerase
MLLDSMRRHSRSFIIYIIFGVIIAVFVVNFGPQSAGCSGGSASYAARVEGNTITARQFAYAMTVAGIRSQQVPEPQMVRLRGMVMDQLLLRELLAEEALSLGVRIPEKEIDDMLVKGRFLALGQPRPLIRDDDGKFDYDLFSRYVRYSWQLTVRKFKKDQRRELLADKYRQFLRSSIKVSEDEVRTDFVQRNTQVSLNYVRFTPGQFRPLVATDEAKIKAYHAAHKKQVKEYYEENKTAYQKLPKQARLQLIRLNAKTEDDAGKREAKRRADAAVKRLKAGEDFAKLAQELSDDKKSRNAGGRLSWRNEDSPGVAEAVDKAVPGLKDGQISELIEIKDGYAVVKLLGRRQGDLTLDKVEEEIAEDLLRAEEATKLAKATANGFIKRHKAGEKLDDLFLSDDDLTTDTDTDADTDADKDKADKDKADAEKPKFKLASTASFSRSGQSLVPGIGISKNLMETAFKLKAGEVAPAPVVIDQMVYLVAIKERKDPDWKEWKKDKDDLAEQYVNQKFASVMRDYVFNRCESSLKEKRLTVNSKAMVTPGYQQPKDEPPLPAYVPCSTLKPSPGPGPGPAPAM